MSGDRCIDPSDGKMYGEELASTAQEEVKESADPNKQRKQVKAASKPKEAADKPPIDKCTSSQRGTGAEMQAANRRPVPRGKFKQGQLVEARFDGGNKWYPGTVTKVLGNRFYALAYDNGDAEVSVVEVMIRPRTEKKPKPAFAPASTAASAAIKSESSSSSTSRSEFIETSLLRGVSFKGRQLSSPPINAATGATAPFEEGDAVIELPSPPSFEGKQLSSSADAHVTFNFFSEMSRLSSFEEIQGPPLTTEDINNQVEALLRINERTEHAKAKQKEEEAEEVSLSLFKYLEEYVAGFPIISSVCTAFIWIAILFEIRGFQLLLENIEALGKLLGTEADLGSSMKVLLFGSFVGVVVLNISVIFHGLENWYRRLERLASRRKADDIEHLVSRRKSGTASGMGMSGAKASILVKIFACLDNMTEGERSSSRRCARCLKHTLKHWNHLYMTYVVTPLLWVLIIVQVLLAISMACIYMLFFAAFESCDSIQGVTEQLAEANIQYEEASAAQAQAMAKQEARQAEQAAQLGQQMQTVDSAMGTDGFGSGVQEFLEEGEYFAGQLDKLCEGIEGLNSGVPLVFFGALVLFFLEMVVCVRHHIFFERDFYELRLKGQNDKLCESRYLLELLYGVLQELEVEKKEEDSGESQSSTGAAAEPGAEAGYGNGSGSVPISRNRRPEKAKRVPVARI